MAPHKTDVRPEASSALAEVYAILIRRAEESRPADTLAGRQPIATDESARKGRSLPDNSTRPAA